MHANHNITATIGFLQGTASASGTIDSLNSGPTGIGTPQIALPTTLLPALVAYDKSLAMAGGPFATYIAAGSPLSSTYNCPSGAPASGCVVFYDGSLQLSGQQTITFTGRVTFVVNGSYTSTGQSQLSFQSGTKSLFVVNGNSDDGGLGTMYALIWAKGDVTLHGNGFQTGQIVAGGNVFFKGGGSSGGFLYDPSLGNFSINLPGHIVMLTYGEY